MNEQLLTAVQIKVIDDASKALQEIKEKFGALDDGIKKQQGFLTKHKEEMAKVGKAALIAGGAILGAAGLAVHAAKQQWEANQQLDAVLASTRHAAGLTAEEVRKMAGALQDVTNYGDETIQTGQNILLTFTNIGKDVFPQATETILNMSTALGQDVKSSAIQLGKALQDPIRGVTALQRVGVNFTEGQKNVIESLVKSGKTMEAQKLILNELETEFGGSARKLADPMVQLKNAVGDAAEELGGALLPVVQELSRQIIPAVKRFTEWAKANPELVGTIAKVVVVLGLLLTTVGTVLVALAKVVSAITVLKGAATAAIPALNALKAALAFLATPLGLVVVAAAAAAIAIVAVTKKINAAWNATASVAAEASNKQQQEWGKWNQASAQLAGNEQKYAQLRAKAQYYILQSTLLTEKQIALIRQHASQDQIDAVQHEIDVNNQWAKDAADAAIDFGKAHTGAADAAKSAYQKIGAAAGNSADAVGGAGESMKDKLEQVKQSVDDLRKEYYDTVVDVNRRLLTLKTEHKKTMDGLSKDIQGVVTDIQKLTSEYKKGMQELVDSHNKALDELSGEKANTVIKQFQKISDLQQEVNDFKFQNDSLNTDQLINVVENRQDKGATLSKSDQQAFHLTDSQADQVNKVLELRKEQEALVKVLQENYTLTKEQGEALKNTYGDTQLAAIKAIIDSNKELDKSFKFNGLTDIEQAFSDIKKKQEETNTDFTKQQTDKNQQYTEELDNLKAQKKELEDRKVQVETAYKAERDELLKTKIKMQEFHDSYTENLQNIEKVTQDTVDGLKAKLEDLRNTISSIDALLQRKAEITGGQTVTSKAKAAKSANGNVFTQHSITEIAENNKPEAVVPLPDGRTIPVTISGQQSGGKGDIHIQIDKVEMKNDMDVQSVFEMLARKLELYRLRSA